MCDLYIVLTILPFEAEFYEREGLAVTYVGNPLLDELPLTRTREEARAALGIESDAGAGPVAWQGPLSISFELFLAAARQAIERGRVMDIVIPQVYACFLGSSARATPVG